MFKTYRSLSSRRRQLGITTVEYAVAGGLIASAVIFGFALLGTNVATVISGIAGSIVN